MSVKENKVTDRRMVEAWVKADTAVMDELLAPDFVHDPPPPGVTGDREGFKKFTKMLYKAFPDHRFKVDDVVAEGDMVATRATISGTHKGEFMGVAPTGKKVTYTVMFFRRYERGKIKQQWSEADMLGVMQQLGAIPAPGKR